MDFTPYVRPVFLRRVKALEKGKLRGRDMQIAQLRRMLSMAADCEVGRRYGFARMADSGRVYEEFSSTVPLTDYEGIRGDVMRMVNGGRDILWPGKCLNFAQSSGTSGGASKFIPITKDSLRHNHLQGAFDGVAYYLHTNPSSRMFSGKGLILGGSFASKVHSTDARVRIGDLSATLIEKTPWPASFFKVPPKGIALMPDWERKLPMLVNACIAGNVTNISGVPSWMMTVLKRVMSEAGVDCVQDVWPGLEVFFHGGISFAPYRDEYSRMCDPARMHYREMYNASEGFFAVQTDPEDSAMMMLLDSGVFYEFIEIGNDASEAVNVAGLERGKVYELVITAMNGLWRYRIGDTVKVTGLDPLKITIAGRTKTFINAFGEELMEHNAEQGIAAACKATGASIRNYTAYPVFAHGNHRGRHEWLVEWNREPADVAAFAAVLDEELQRLNSDYEAKRTGGIFLDPLTIVTLPDGTFDRWLSANGSGRLGGQRKIPRLSNSPAIASQLLSLL